MWKGPVLPALSHFRGGHAFTIRMQNRAGPCVFAPDSTATGMLETAPNNHLTEGIAQDGQDHPHRACPDPAALAALPLAAQTTDGTGTGDTAGDRCGGDNLSLGQEVNAGGVGDTYTAATFEDWEQRCVRTESGDRPLPALQASEGCKQGNNVAEFTDVRPAGRGRRPRCRRGDLHRAAGDAADLRHAAADR
jgi:hypothetical protein